MTQDLQTYKEPLLHIARASIQHGLQHGSPLSVSTNDYDDAIIQNAATFVTLHKNHELRGCIGQLQATRPLVIDVAMNAYAAAFQDPRFSPLTENEYPEITLDISVLSQPELITANSDKELLAQLRVGQDGLILEKGVHRATFLPSVWEQLPEPKDFLHYLKRKAGLEDKDVSGITYHRYHTIYLQEDARSSPA